MKIRAPLLLLLVPAMACGSPSGEAQAAAEQPSRSRREMVARQIAARGVADEAVLSAMLAVPRHRFVPEFLSAEAYRDSPLPIGDHQTISQPYIVAYMTEALELDEDDRVLEIGTGSGYQAAVLAEIVREVYSIEIVPSLAVRAALVLREQGYDNLHLRTGDGYIGWPEAAPFDAILVTAAPDHVPQPLIDQLAPGGRLVIPVGRRRQEILRLRRTPQGVQRETLIPVRFVPMTGKAQEH